MQRLFINMQFIEYLCVSVVGIEWLKCFQIIQQNHIKCFK